MPITIIVEVENLIRDMSYYRENVKSEGDRWNNRKKPIIYVLYKDKENLKILERVFYTLQKL